MKNDNILSKEHSIKINIEHLWFGYQNGYVLRDINARFKENTITAIVGSSGKGKSTFLMTLNRLWETLPNTRMKGRVEIRFGEEFQDIYHPSCALTHLRRTVGMVFQSPNPLPMSIYKNVTFPLKLAGYKDKSEIARKAEIALKQAFLWKEVKERLSDSALSLSGGQQQRLCIARALILEPEVLLLDEPTSSLDVKAGAVIEELLLELKNRCTLLMVSHSPEQVRRITDTVMELSDGVFSDVSSGKLME